MAGTIKRLIACANLQCSYNDQIMTLRQLYDWATGSIPSYHFKYSVDKGYENHSSVWLVPGTQKLHCVTSVICTTVKTKMYSNLTEYKIEPVLLNQ